jgi:hypothetical protein
VGTILTVSITVVLFSGIMLYVGTMPQPKGTTTASFAGQTTYNTDSKETFINITQMGGQSLSLSDTRVLITVNGGQYGDYSLADGGLLHDWVPGMMWSKHFTSITQTDEVKALIYQKSVGDVIWQGLVSDTDVTRMPVISNKGMWDGGYVYNSPIFNGSMVRFFVLFAATQDIQYLNSSTVRMDGSSIGYSSSLAFMKDPANQFMFYTASFYTTSYSWTGQRVSFTFTTSDGRAGPIVYSTLNVLANPGSQTGAGNNVDPTPKMMVNALNSYAIFEYNDWAVNKYSATPRTSFSMGQKVVFAVASQSLLNCKVDDSLYLYDRSTGAVIVAASSPTYKFYFNEYTGGYYVFNATLATSSLPRNDEIYPVRISLMDNSQPTNQAIILTNITIGAPTTYLATLRTYASDADRSSGTTTSSFSVTDKIYVRITVPSGSGAWQSSIGMFYIAGFSGVKQVNVQVGGIGTNPVNNVVFYEKSGSNYYDMRVDLANSSQDVWALGTNKYTIAYNPFTTLSSQYYVAWTISVTSPMYDYDLAVASGPLSSSANGMASILQYYPGEYRWMRATYPIPQFSENKPGSGSYTPPNALITRVGDVDGDAINEVMVLASGQGGVDIEMYDYFQNQWWARIAVLVGASGTIVTDFQIATLGFSNQLDIIYSVGRNIYRVTNQGTFWSQQPVIVTGFASNADVKGFIVANFTSTTGSQLGSDIVAWDKNGHVESFRYCYRDAPIVYAQTVSLVGSSDLAAGYIHSSATAKAKFFLIDSLGGMNFNGYWSTSSNKWVFNGSTVLGTVTNAKHMSAGNFVLGQKLCLVILGVDSSSYKHIFFILQATENSFAVSGNSIRQTTTSTGASIGITSFDVADVNDDGLDDLVISDNLAADQLATGQGLVRLAINSHGAIDWWGISSNTIIINTVFGQINNLDAGVTPATLPY